MNEKKLKDMVRSILPSKNRVPARKAKAMESRRVRRAVRGELHVEDPEMTKADLKRAAVQTYNVRWRRDGDKLNHFMRWGDAITKGMPAEEALSFVRSILPKNLIGDHAYGHWEQHRKPRQYPHYKPRKRVIQSWIDSTRFHLRRAIGEEPALHGRLNAMIKARKMFEERRLLAGIHDVDAFVADIADDDRFGAERAATRDIIEEHEKGGRKAALRISGRNRRTVIVLLPSLPRLRATVPRHARTQNCPRCVSRDGRRVRGLLRQDGPGHDRLGLH